MGLLFVIRPKGLYTYKHGQLLIKDIKDTATTMEATGAHCAHNNITQYPQWANTADWASRAIDPDHKDVQSRAMLYTTTAAEGQRACFTRSK